MSFLLANQPKTIQMPVNPLDKSTIISVYPRDIIENKPTISPGLFTIPAADGDKFSVTVVGPSSWWRHVEDNQPLLEISNSSIQIAESLIRDYCSGLIGCNMGDKMPGLFFIPGEFDEITVFKYSNFTGLLEQARTRQKNWFAELVKLADVMWARTQGNPLAISDDARLAAELLGLDKPWMQDFQSIQLSNCPACGTMVNPAYPICSNCKMILNKEKAGELGIEFAK